jgi:type IV secretory pathway VirB2 component (pilin)
MKKLILTNLLSFLLFFTFVLPVALAQQSPAPSGSNSDINSTIPNPLRADNLVEFFNQIINELLLPIGGILAVIAFIWSGFKFVSAQGDPGKIKEARTALWYTAIGTAILLGATALTKVIVGTIDALK